MRQRRAREPVRGGRIRLRSEPQPDSLCVAGARLVVQGKRRDSSFGYRGKKMLLRAEAGLQHQSVFRAVPPVPQWLFGPAGGSYEVGKWRTEPG